MQQSPGRPVATTMGYTGLAIKAHFGALRPDQITTDHCRSYTAQRRAVGISIGSVWTELGHLRTCMTWAADKARLIPVAPYIERPQKPAPKDRYLTHAEIERLLAADCEPHIRLAILLMLTTAARVGAVLDLTWDRVDMDRGQINLRADCEGPRKGRAVVPINATMRAALMSAREAALSDFVVEWAGVPVRSIRKGFERAVKSAGLNGVSPHVLRHTAAVHMAEGGVPMSKISQYLGHSSTAVTERVYARYAPDHLREAAEILDFGRVRGVR
ncbi:tyrosine-type recombinase/integrase [Phaeovulum veldkampii]|nr:site-specific integrase [Phaeovulum veldkampii]